MKKLLVAAAALCVSVFCNAASAANPVVEMKTSQGTITIELYADKAPRTVDNFLQYVKDGFYNGTLFHRVIPTFMIQGGGYEPGMKEKRPREPIANEANNGLKNKRGTIAMARTNDPHSASAQFFVNVVDNDSLDFRAPSSSGWGYAVFGKVAGGMDVVDKIRAVKTGVKAPFTDVPLEIVVIESVKLLPEKKQP